MASLRHFFGTLLNLNAKVVRSWKEALEKANAQYQEAKLASACSLENILGRWQSQNLILAIIIIVSIIIIIIMTRWDGEDLEESGYPGGFLHAPISRRGSRRSSRYSRWGRPQFCFLASPLIILTLDNGFFTKACIFFPQHWPFPLWVC